MATQRTKRWISLVVADVSALICRVELMFAFFAAHHHDASGGGISEGDEL
jgi:hypothetical protein